MAKCKRCQRKKTIFKDGLCFFCYQDLQESKAREGKTTHRK